MRVALVIGHKKESQGACNHTGICEFMYNKALVNMISTRLTVENVIVYRQTYETLPRQINYLEPELVISFHCNAYNTKVSGTETLYHHTDDRSKKIAQQLQDTIVDTLRLKNRGIKPKSTEDRGGYLLKYVHAPCVIIEPFFIDNDMDMKVGNEKIAVLADNIAKFINAYRYK